MSRWGQSTRMPEVPTIVNSGPPPPDNTDKIIQFENVLDAADAGVKSLFASRRRAREESSPCAIGGITKRVKLGFDDSDDEEDDEPASGASIAQVLVKTIAATTGVEAPTRLSTTREAVQWASKAIVDARTAAITATRRERYMHALDPTQTLQAMELIESLTSLISGTPRPHAPASLATTPHERARTPPISSRSATG